MRGLSFTINDAYVMPFKVLWQSLMKTESVPTGTPVFISHEATLTPPSIEDLTAFIGQYGFEVSFVIISSRVPDQLPFSKDSHINRANFYRLYLASTLPKEIDSVVYLDVDAVVVRSIKELFETELTLPIAAVDHLSPIEALRLWGDKSGSYFQSGVLVIDLNAWRSLDCEAVFAKILARDRFRIQWADQCVLNIAFENNWQRLPVWFNVCGWVCKVIDSSRLDQEGRFLHFDGGGKPWKCISRQNHALLWYEAYADAFGHAFDYQSIKRSIWRRIGSEAKRVSLFVVRKVKVFTREYFLS